MNLKSGQVAYEAYVKFSEGKSLVSGATLPSWYRQSEEIKQAWEAAADAVLNDYKARLAAQW